jgi:serine protease Do
MRFEYARPVRRNAAAALTAALLLIAPIAPNTAGLAGAQAVVTQSGQEPLSFAPLIERTAPAVVNIYAQKIVGARSPAPFLDGSAFWRLFSDTLLFGYGRERIENSLGSGVIVRADGIIVTNHHVVDAASGVVVALADGRAYPAAILVSDKRTDIAVLHIDTRGESLPTIEFGDSDLVRVGDRVLAIGNPFGLGQTVTSGIVSALARTSIGIADFRFFIQTDAAINPGNSGGAQIAMDGKLVGINTAIFSTSGGSQGLGFAIPSNMVRMVVEAALAQRPLVRAWIGLSGRRVPAQAATKLGLPARGVLVTGTYEGSPAEKAGLAIGDIILSIDGFPVDEPQALRYRIATRPVGSEVRLTVVRNRIRMEIPVSLVAPPDVPPRDETRLQGLNPLSGAKVASLSPALAEEIGLDSGISGVVVLNLAQGSAADRLGIEAGDIIRAIDAVPVETVDQLLAFHVTPFKTWTIDISRGGEDLAIEQR